MAYTTVPIDVNENLSVSQPKITENFALINTIISQDHETFDAIAGEGKHKQVTLTEQAADPANLDNQMLLYSKDNGAESALYLRKEGAAGRVLNFVTALRDLEIRYGSGTIAVDTSSQPISFGGAGFNFPNGIIAVFLTPTGNLESLDTIEGQIIGVNAKTTAGFTATRTYYPAYRHLAVNFDYLAIGY